MINCDCAGQGSGGGALSVGRCWDKTHSREEPQTSAGTVLYVWCEFVCLDILLHSAHAGD